MSKIYVTTTAKETRYAPFALSNYKRILRAAEKDRLKTHELVDSPAAADVILFVESQSPFHLDVFASPIFKKYKHKCCIFDFNDNSIPRIPGLYMGIPPAYRSVPIYKYGFYVRVFDNHMTQSVKLTEDREYLYSFVGSVANCPRVRAKIMDLPSQQAFLLDRRSGQSDSDSSYVEIMAKSKFVICPRGVGPSSWRVFETMSAGRVPVIVSDSWVPPQGPKWSEFAVIVKENSIHEIPNVCKVLQSEAERMGAIARQAWIEHFGLESAFNWIVDSLMAINGTREGFCDFINRSVVFELAATGNVISYARSLARHAVPLFSRHWRT